MRERNGGSGSERIPFSAPGGHSEQKEKSSLVLSFKKEQLLFLAYRIFR
jgi:hypothetical protein